MTDLGFLSEKANIFAVQFKMKDNAVAGPSAVNIVSATYTLDDSAYTPVPNKLSGTVHITGKVNIQIGSAGGTADSTVDVPVTVKDAETKVGSYGFQINFDAAALEVTAIAGHSGDSFDSVFNNTAGMLKAGWADKQGGDAGLGAGDKLFTVTFRIKDDATAGNKALTVKEDELEQFTVTDTLANEMRKTVQPGNVEVKPPVHKLAASPGNGKVDLGWNSVTGATYYDIYMGTASGVYGVQPSSV